MKPKPQYPEAELARVADGSLLPKREAELRNQAAASAEGRAALAEQQHALSMLRGLDAPAPDALRTTVAAEIAAAEHRASRRLRLPAARPRIAFPALGTALVAAVVAIVLASGGGTGAPTLAAAVRITLAAARLPAPAESSHDTLSVAAAGIPFPYWQRSVGWRAVGARSDRLDGRAVKTVFYVSPHGQRVGYAIVGGAPLTAGGGRVVTLEGVPFRILREGPATLITWVRAGHTCVIAGRTLGAATLVRLATA